MGLSQGMGACGHTYGDHNIWQMWLPTRPPTSIARTPWTETLHHPGSQQMKYFRELFEARPFWKMRRDKAMTMDSENVHAGWAQGGSFGVVYLPQGQPVTVSLEQVSGESINAWWFNPRQNSSQLIGEFNHVFSAACTVGL
ncbi:apiosidase-like domain-containing protein [Novipirellula artificiosorum]|uniref:Putative collagen-binding domain of a collagenase n=1 Tax=Novipirellula artificiosorum TaxID=2528016 RepID=A0A5C6D937_9BACT|nr:DUF4038 domain-containing protein [Novipirellula artificiosorum]TWU33258.1 putative collagen-binding domain of a collagenase [Novipirellula artificiosorum]